MKLHLLDLEEDSIRHGPGVRMAVLLGEEHVYDYDVSTLAAKSLANPSYQGVTIIGEEKRMQSKSLMNLAKIIHGYGLNILYSTNYSSKELKEISGKDTMFRRFLSYVDQIECSNGTTILPL